MGEFDALAAEIYKEKIRRARLMSPEEKFLAGQELFDFSCQFTLAGIASQHPLQTESEHREILQKRLKIADILERKKALGVPQ